MPPFTVTQLDITPTPVGHNVTVTTNLPIELTLLTTTTAPNRRDRTRTRRGVPYVCGFDLLWPPGTCWLATPPGPQLTRTFTVLQPANSPPLHATLIASPTCTLPAASTPPFAIPAPGGTVALPTVTAVLNTPFSLPNNSTVSIPLDSVLELFGLPAWTLVGGNLIAPSDGIAIIRGRFYIQAALDTTLAIHIQPALGAYSAADERSSLLALAGRATEATWIGPVHAGEAIALLGFSSIGPAPLGGFGGDHTGMSATYTSLGL